MAVNPRFPRHFDHVEQSWKELDQKAKFRIGDVIEWTGCYAVVEDYILNNKNTDINYALKWVYNADL